MREPPKEFSKLWKEISEHPDKSILRLAILRDLSRQLHAERSMHLAQGKIPQGQTLEQIELQLAAIRGREKLLSAQSLEEALSQASGQEAIKTEIPESLAAIIPRSKLERYDRQWEAALATGAFQRGWAIWELYTTIQVAKAEVFHKHLSQSLWPKGLILFVESGNPSSNIEEGSWNGHWFITSISSLNPAHLEIEASPGVRTGGSFSAPTWHPLFPETRR